jgi:1-acylglycerone phosphate reductase
MRIEFAPFNVKVVTIVTGAVKSNILQNTAVSRVPESSPYFPIRDAIEKRTFLSGHKDMPGDEYARKVVSDLLSNPRPLLWRGAYATLVWFSWCFGWTGMLVSLTSLPIPLHHGHLLRPEFSREALTNCYSGQCHPEACRAQ